MEKKRVKITTDYITLGQMLKLTNIIANGGEAKAFLASHDAKVNGELDCRRGRKLREGDVIEIDGVTIEIEK